MCAIAEVNHPTAADWTTHFVGYDEVTKLKVDAAFDDWVDFGKPEQELEAPARRRSEAAADQMTDTSICDSVDNDVIEF